MQGYKSERKHKRWIEWIKALKQLLTIMLPVIFLLGLRREAIKARYRSKMEEEIEREIERKRRRERNKSQLERELALAK